MPSTVLKVDVTARVLTLLVLCLASTFAQIFLMPTFAAIFAQGGVALALAARLAIGTMGVLGHPAVSLLLIAGVGYLLWKKWGDAAQRLALMGVASFVFALILVGQASVLLSLALLRVRLGS